MQNNEDSSQGMSHCGWQVQDLPTASAAMAAMEAPLLRAQQAEDRMLRLVRTVEAEIVPRLVIARASLSAVAARSATLPATGAAPDIYNDEVREFARLLVAHDFAIAFAFVEAVRHRGATAQFILLELMAPAARLLGKLWEDDDMEFTQVTLGLCRLHQVLHRLNAEFAGEETATVDPNHRALLCCVPGDQHTFGIVMVGQFLRRSGWDVWIEFPANDAQLLETVSSNSFNLVGMSIGSDRRIPELAYLVKTVRGASRNKAVSVMLGGSMLLNMPELVRSAGADATAVDGMQAALWAQARFGTSMSLG